MTRIKAGVVRPIRIAAIAVVMVICAGAAQAIDDSVLTELSAFGLIDQEEFEQIEARREVVVISIREGQMEPREVHVTPNTVVVLHNQDVEESHFIYITPDENNDLTANALTEMIEPDGRWAATFTLGEYPFHCARHPDNLEEAGRIYVSQ